MFEKGNPGQYYFFEKKDRHTKRRCFSDLWYVKIHLLVDSLPSKWCCFNDYLPSVWNSKLCYFH